MIRQHYLTTFPEVNFERPDFEDETQAVDSSKIYKMNYSINLLPYVCPHLEMRVNSNGILKETWVNSKYDVLELLKESKEYDIFKSKAVLDLIKFKWINFGFHFHLIGFANHFLLLTLLIIYDVKVYLNDGLYQYVDNPTMPKGKERVRIDPHGNDFAYILLIGIAYQLVYVLFQMKRIGIVKLVTQPWKVDSTIYIDMLYIAICILVSLIH